MKSTINPRATKEIETNEVNSTIYKNFFVDLVMKPATVEVWLCHKDYDTKTLMFGIPHGDNIIEIINNNLDQYIKSYIEEVID